MTFRVCPRFAPNPWPDSLFRWPWCQRRWPSLSHPLVGLYAAFIVGLITSLTGGRPGMISGATGSLAVVMVSLVSENGIEYLFITVVLMGIIQMAVGLLRLGNLIRMVPFPVMLGFVNGLAIVIFMARTVANRGCPSLTWRSWLA